MNLIKRSMLSKTTVAAIIAMLVLASLATVALADVPPKGTVYEGQGVPGADLGAPRYKVESGYGKPVTCFSFSPTRESVTCTYLAGGNGSVIVTYANNVVPTPVGEEAQAIVSQVSWRGLGDWYTTHGVNTLIAQLDPEQAAKAYPNAKVVYTEDGEIRRITSAELGIDIWRQLDTGSGRVLVTMTVFKPGRFDG